MYNPSVVREGDLFVKEGCPKVGGICEVEEETVPVPYPVGSGS